jgi:hypothetical protein
MPLLRDNRLAHDPRLPPISQEENPGKRERTIGSENMRGTIWKSCVKCGKQFYYDARIKKCATCCRLAREAKHQKKRNVTIGGVHK